MCSALLVLSVALCGPGAPPAASAATSPPGPRLRLGIGVATRWTLREQLRLGSVTSALSRPPGWGLGPELRASYGDAVGLWVQAGLTQRWRRYRVRLAGAPRSSLTVRRRRLGAWIGYGVPLTPQLSLRPGVGLSLHQRRLPPAPGVLIQELSELRGEAGARLDWRPGLWELRAGVDLGRALGIWERRPTSGRAPAAWATRADVQGVRWLGAHLGLALALGLRLRLIRFEGLPERPLPTPEVGSRQLSQRETALTAALRLVYRP